MNSNHNYNSWFALSEWGFNAFYAFLLLLMCNSVFFKKFYEVTPSITFFCLGLVCIYFMLVIACDILLWKPWTKLFAFLILWINAGIDYFMITYNIAFDKMMLLNILNTNMQEIKEIISYSSLWYFLFLGLLPSILVYKIRIISRGFFFELVRRLVTSVCLFLIVIGILFLGFKTTAQFMRNNHQLKYWFIPINYFSAGISIGKQKLKDHYGRVLIPIAEDAKLNPAWKQKPNIVVIVVGETARAANWGLNGYKPDTTEPLKPYLREIFNFTQTSSCGTSTEVSVPCMFAKSGRNDFNLWRDVHKENLLDVASKSGYDVLWIDNNSGCKGVCARVPKETPCLKEVCYDEILHQKLRNKLAFLHRNQLVVLHQIGSHGPTYHLRYPVSEAYYKPSCQTERLDKCRDEEIVNAYNNTIRYTAKNLAEIIQELKFLEGEYNVSLIYMSDHGESLGENGIYLHAAPYRWAPKGQKHIPFMIWMGKQTRNNFGINKKCMEPYLHHPTSHDNLFHTALGLLGIETKDYDPKQDVFATCRRTRQ